MNIDQILSILRVLLSVGGPVGALLAARGMSPDQVTALSTSILTIVGAAPPIIAAIWGAFAHTDSAKIAATEALSGVAAVVTKTTATNGTLAAAQNPAQPKVVMATPALTAAIAAAPAGAKP